jgi:hypothetical protein
MYTDLLSRITNPVTGETRLMGPVEARARLGNYQHMLDRTMAKLATITKPKNGVQLRMEARLWEMAFRYEGWIQALEAYLSGGES